MSDLPAAHLALTPWLLVWLGAGANLLAGLHYTYNTVRAPSGNGAQPKPNPVSWGIWSLSGWLVFLGQVSEGVRNEALLTLCVAAVPTFIFVASIVSRRRYGAYAPVSRLDMICGGLAILALAAWRVTASGSVAVALSIACDALVAVPVVRQAYRDPSSDSPGIWIAGAANAVITLATFQVFTFLAAGFALYFLALCLLVSFLLVVRPRLQYLTDWRTIRGRADLSAKHVDITRRTAVFAGAFAADYLTWDEADPNGRARALDRYIDEAADPLWGWSGRGCQRVDLVLLDGVELDLDGYYVVDVRVRVASPDSTGSPQIVSAATVSPATGDDTTVEIPLPGTARSRSRTATAVDSPANSWLRLQIPVLVNGDRLRIPT